MKSMRIHGNFLSNLLTLGICLQLPFSAHTQNSNLGVNIVQQKIYPNGYESGQMLREKFANVVTEEKGQVIKVPLDYSNPNLGKTEIYIHLGVPEKKFDPNLPTIVIVDGGPGSSSHSQIDDSIYKNLRANVLRFDQRGIAFSRFANVELALNSDYYSSEYTARDIAVILKELQISKATIWGSSYGTVPATIFGNLFPDKTHALILEGTMVNGYDGDSQTINSVLYRLNHVFKLIPKKSRDNINLAVEQKVLDPSLVPEIIDSVIGTKGGLDVMRFVSSDFVKKIGELATSKIQEHILGRSGDSPVDKSSVPRSEKVVSQILKIKEFAAWSPQGVHSFYLQGGEIIPNLDPKANPFLLRKELFSFVKPLSSPLSMLEYPVSAPVFYFQGVMDIRTPPREAIKHYKEVAKKSKKMILFKHVGHSVTPAVTHLGTENDQALLNAFLNDVIEKATSSVDLRKIQFVPVIVF